MDNKTKISRINELQVISYRNGGLTQDQRNEWNGITSELEKDGIKLGRKYSYGRTIWYAKRNMKANMVCEMDFVDMSPKHKHLKGNCTTRAMAYCLPNSHYDDIEQEQYRFAKTQSEYVGRTFHRNSRGIWEKVLTHRGWKRYKLNGTIRRDRVTNLLRQSVNPIVTVSCSHASVAHAGKCVDTWDCRGGRVCELVVSPEDFGLVERKLQFSIRSVD